MTTTTTRPAHETVTARAANSTPVEWAVSGDESVRAHGYIGMRKARNAVSLWDMPGVKPKIETAGIRVGDTIHLYYGPSGVVTRVGTIAGFFDVDGIERRWEIEQVEHIEPAS